MKFHRLIILGAAAWAGTMFYKLQYVPSDAVSATSGETAAPRSIYSSVTGSGSLGQTLKTSTDARTDARTAGQQPPINNPAPQNQISVIAPRKQRGSSPAVEDMAPDDLSLIQAAAKGDKNIVERKLSQHVKVDSRDAYRRTPLMYASWNGFDDISNRLLAAGANPEFKDRQGNNAFDYAASRGLIDSLHFLLQRTHTNDDQHYMEYAQIILATYAGDPARLPAGNGKLASVNHRIPEGQAPLHIAASNGYVALMDALIRRGANVNIPNDSKQTPLHWAAWNNQAQALTLLLNQGGDLTATDVAKNTPLLLAAQNNGIEAAKVLLAKGADRYAANKDGKTPSIIAEDNGFPELAKLLK